MAAAKNFCFGTMTCHIRFSGTCTCSLNIEMRPGDDASSNLAPGLSMLVIYEHAKSPEGRITFLQKNDERLIEEMDFNNLDSILTSYSTKCTILLQ